MSRAAVSAAAARPAAPTAFAGAAGVNVVACAGIGIVAAAAVIGNILDGFVFVISGAGAAAAKRTIRLLSLCIGPQLNLSRM